MFSLQSSIPGLLPPDILEKVVIFTADSNEYAVSLKLCTISRLFYESTVKRLYHTIIIQKISRLKKILRTSALQKPWVAACVRVLLINSADEFPQGLVPQVLVLSTGLLSLCLPSLVVINETCSLPHLRRIAQTNTGFIPPHIAPHITHLYLYDDSSSLISHILGQKSALGSLTHVLVVNVHLYHGTASTESYLDILQANIPQGLPESLRAFVIFVNFEHEDLTNPPDKTTSEGMQGVMNVDPRIVFWKSVNKRTPAWWTGPRLFEFDTQGRLIDQCLGAMPDGAAGLWEAVDSWIAHRDTAEPYP
ncbi:hypothetical protein DL96DRAFT_1817963 [Flagelloscypha sp. PMI_526]|nr:hypothetical protein DL96DRAFT_1817963 [Flagelloscypha sp. PMI_526]